MCRVCDDITKSSRDQSNDNAGYIHVCMWTPRSTYKIFPNNSIYIKHAHARFVVYDTTHPVCYTGIVVGIHVCTDIMSPDLYSHFYM